MKQSLSLSQLAAQIEAQTASRKDFVAPQGRVTARATDSGIVLDGFADAPLGIRDHAHGQLAQALTIPKTYYDRMRTEQPELLTRNINTWLAGGELLAMTGPSWRAIATAA